MIISILTLFPQMFAGPFHESILKHAQEKKLLSIDLVDIRAFSTDRYKSVDDHPYGGGHGMIMRVDVIDRALQSVKGKNSHVILLDPRGTSYTQKKALTLSTIEHLVLICGHYEGIDERVASLVDETLSIGDYVLTGGEIPAMCVVDSVARLLPGVLAHDASSREESFTTRPDYLEYPQYTRPPTYKSMNVPEVLLSGDHKKITKWREQNAKTKKHTSA